jgi:hypothetical protein
MTNSTTRQPTTNEIDTNIANVSSQAQNKASTIARNVVDNIDRSRDAAAGGVEIAASKILSAAASLQGGSAVSGAAHAAANSLNSTADYIRKHDVSGMMADLQQLVKNNAVPALLGAAFIGFLVGRSFSNDD